MSTTVPSPARTRACCENGRPIMRDPHTGQTICSCQYGTALLNYSRTQGLPEEIYGTSTAAYVAGAKPGYIQLPTEGSAFYSPLMSPVFDIKEGSEAWRALVAHSGGCFPYENGLAIYPYGTGYAGLDLNARRKNATRETTNTLKAWLYEHRKNPYPTKGEKIMLAIITKMTLTQVSTWFANARRRLKKENKMTWSPRNRSEDDDDDDNDDIEERHNNQGDSLNDLNISHSDLDISENRNEMLAQKSTTPAEKIICVDEDEPDHNITGEPNSNSDGKETDSCGENETNISSTCTGFLEQTEDKNKSNTETQSSVSSEKQHIQTGGTMSGNTSHTKPKIWSVTNFLGNSSAAESTVKCSDSTDTPAIVCSRQTLKPPYLNPCQLHQLPLRLHGYSLSLSHSAVSFPHALSFSSNSKVEKHVSDLNSMNHAVK